MAVRNFWISADIDGRKTPLHGGPVRKDGGFSLTVYMRDEGGIAKPLTISGYAASVRPAGGDSEEILLRLNVYGPDGTQLFTHATERG